MAQSNSGNRHNRILPQGGAAHGPQNGNRAREPLEEGRRGTNRGSQSNVILAELFYSKRLEWECNYCIMIYDGATFSKRLPGRPESLPLTEKELSNFRFAIRAAAGKDRNILFFVKQYPNEALREMGLC